MGGVLDRGCKAGVENLRGGLWVSGFGFVLLVWVLGVVGREHGCVGLKQRMMG